MNDLYLPPLHETHTHTHTYTQIHVAHGVSARLIPFLFHRCVGHSCLAYPIRSNSSCVPRVIKKIISIIGTLLYLDIANTLASQSLSPTPTPTPCPSPLCPHPHLHSALFFYAPVPIVFLHNYVKNISCNGGSEREGNVRAHLRLHYFLSWSAIIVYRFVSFPVEGGMDCPQPTGSTWSVVIFCFQLYFISCVSSPKETHSDWPIFQQLLIKLSQKKGSFFWLIKTNLF